MPPGSVTRPPFGSSTVRRGRAPNDADTFLSPFIVTVHVVRVPLHEPPQLRKEKPLFGVAVRMTLWLGRKVAVQVPGQLMPPPLTVPLLGAWTVRRGRGPKDAGTFFSPFIVRGHVAPGPPHPPPPPRKMKHPAGRAGGGADWPG